MYQTFRSTITTFKSAPLHFFLLQFLEGISSIFAKCLEGRFESSPITAVVLFFPVFCVASTVSNGLTFISVSQRVNGQTVTFSEIFTLIQPALGKLILASMALGAVFILGFAALIIPAFYFMAIYLFVPQILATEPQLPISLALFRSTKLAKRDIRVALTTVIAGLLIGIVTFLASEVVARWAGGITQNATTRLGISLFIDTFLSMATGAIIDLWIAHLFLKLVFNKEVK